MKSVLAALLLIAALPLQGLAADRVLTVSGEGNVSIAPDMATISVGVVSNGDSAAGALQDNSDQVAKLLATLKAAGIADRDIQTTGLNLNPLYDNRSYDGGQPKITGYQASNVVTIRVRALDGLGALLDQVVSVGANQLNGLTFGLADPKPSADAARKQAVDDAMDRARLLAGAAGVTLGPIQSISESGSYQDPQPMFRREAVASSVPVAGGEVGVRAQVTITFALSD